MSAVGRLTAVLGAIAISGFPSLARAGYSGLYVFGDSLSDAGNVYALTGAPTAPYDHGMFSNGPIWVDYLARSLGLPEPTPSVLSGNDYAWGDATTGYPPTNASMVPTFTAQVSTFLAGHGGVAPSSALYSVWIGSNDVLNVLTQVAGGLGVPAATELIAGAARTQADGIGLLAAAGARNFLIPFVPDLGLTPDATTAGPSAVELATQLSGLYDADLVADLAGLHAIPGIRLSYLDTYAELQKVVADQRAFDLSNVTDPCYSGSYDGGGTVCADPDGYLFWDHLHPTTAGQAIVAHDALAVLPVPSSIATPGIGLIGLTAWRRRRRE